MTTRWQAMGQVLRNLGQTLVQDNSQLRFALATVASFLLVSSRCLVVSNTAVQAQGTPQQDVAQTAEAQTFFREWGAFFTSYGVVNTVGMALGAALLASFGVTHTAPPRTGLLTATRQLAGLALGTRSPASISPLPTALGQQKHYQLAGTSLHLKPVLHALARLKGQAPPTTTADYLAHFKSLHQWAPPLIGSSIAVVLSGWVLERLALAKGPQLITLLKARLNKPDSGDSPQPPAETARPQVPYAPVPPRPVAGGRAPALKPVASTVPARIGLMRGE